MEIEPDTCELQIIQPTNQHFDCCCRITLLLSRGCSMKSSYKVLAHSKFFYSIIHQHIVCRDKVLT